MNFELAYIYPFNRSSPEMYTFRISSQLNCTLSASVKSKQGNKILLNLYTFQ